MGTLRQKTSLEDIYAPVQEKLKKVPDTVLAILTSPNDLAGEVIRYFFSRQGKLLRPALTLLGAEMFNRGPSGSGGDPERRLLHLASAFEVFHSATLIHDDIIDSAYIRRHIPTINVKWGPEVAVLVGDYMHDRANRTIFYHGDEKIMALFLQTAGTVCDGEIHEIKEKDNFNLTEEEYIEIITKKTAELLACTVEAGGLFAGATPEQAAALKRFGRNFGIAFQITDDCLDFTGQEQEFGKTLGKDCAVGVLTLPLIRLIHLVDENKKGQVFKIFKSEMGTRKYETLYAMVTETGAIDYAMARAREFSDRARLELAVFCDSPAKQSLEQLVQYVIERKR
ncbi:MAG: polyprenyl synthetase family protein [Candidatus Omnitrophica bacterium]|nr:polyprenyl synthetase family protein [Candidatus Omnitrophota bacterium]